MQNGQGRADIAEWQPLKKERAGPLVEQPSATWSTS